MLGEIENPPFQQQRQLSHHDGQLVHEEFWNAQGQPAGYELGGRGFLQMGGNGPMRFDGSGVGSGSGGSGIPEFQDTPNFHGANSQPIPTACQYSDRPEVFGSPPLDGYGNYVFGGNLAQHYNTPPTIRVQAPEEFGGHENLGTLEVAGHGEECVALPFQRGLGALKLATEESWQVMREPINPVLAQVNEKVGYPPPTAVTGDWRLRLC